MKFTSSAPKLDQAASALLMTVLLTTIALITVAGVLTYSVGTARLNYRLIQYHRAVSAAEGDTEKVAALISRDFLSGGEVLVTANLASYRGTTLNGSDSSYWADWEFNDASGNTGQTFIELGDPTNDIVATPPYAGLHRYVSTCTVVSNARQTDAAQDVVGGVLQQLQISHIPVFQFLMYSSGDMEISCGEPFTITGPVHSNGHLYIEPDNVMMFESGVTAVIDILPQRSPFDSRHSPSGSVVYEAGKTAPVPALTLPIGTTNTPTAVREIVQPPPPFENRNSALGRLRYYNQADLVVVVTNNGISATSGSFNSFNTPIPASELTKFISTNSSFTDWRETKTVLPIDIDIGAFTAWSATNSNERAALGGRDVSSIYVWDCRTLPPGDNLGAVRLDNGLQLPPEGLTVATASPLYVLGHYNQTNLANLGTANTSTTLPASLVADAVTILSPNWSDTNSMNAVASRLAAPTTVNAAILAGAVESAGGQYGGGMENFPRFLEYWGSTVFTYNGSLVKMFPSLYATNMWGRFNVYKPPTRHWAFDLNFNDPTKLPPLTPSLLVVIRGQWATVAPNQTTAPVH